MVSSGGPPGGAGGRREFGLSAEHKKRLMKRTASRVFEQDEIAASAEIANGNVQGTTTKNGRSKSSSWMRKIRSFVTLTTSTSKASSAAAGKKVRPAPCTVGGDGKVEAATGKRSSPRQPEVAAGADSVRKASADDKHGEEAKQGGNEEAPALPTATSRPGFGVFGRSGSGFEKFQNSMQKDIVAPVHVTGEEAKILRKNLRMMKNKRSASMPVVIRPETAPDLLSFGGDEMNSVFLRDLMSASGGQEQEKLRKMQEQASSRNTVDRRTFSSASLKTSTDFEQLFQIEEEKMQQSTVLMEEYEFNDEDVEQVAMLAKKYPDIVPIENEKSNTIATTSSRPQSRPCNDLERYDEELVLVDDEPPEVVMQKTNDKEGSSFFEEEAEDTDAGVVPSGRTCNAGLVTTATQAVDNNDSSSPSPSPSSPADDPDIHDFGVFNTTEFIPEALLQDGGVQTTEETKDGGVQTTGETSTGPLFVEEALFDAEKGNNCARNTENKMQTSDEITAVVPQQDLQSEDEHEVNYLTAHQKSQLLGTLKLEKQQQLRIAHCPEDTRVAILPTIVVERDHKVNNFTTTSSTSVPPASNYKAAFFLKQSSTSTATVFSDASRTTSSSTSCTTDCRSYCYFVYCGHDVYPGRGHQWR
ncbi:unnamed protein product [Amoebophrya sp. A120]|nr:unnamed protein product [Amoebophrya sp. A120]|eukprot:GSA120T00009797001.1